MDRLYWVLFDSAVGYINEDGTSDWSDPAEIDVAGDSLAPAAPTVSASPKPNAILLSITPPTLNSDGTTCVDFKEYGVYYSASGSIDITNAATYDGLYTVAGGKNEVAEHSHPATTITYFVVTAYDTFGNQSVASSEVSTTPTGSESPIINLVPNSFFELDADGDGVPDQWTADAAWVRNTDSYYGSYSMKAQGTDKDLVSDKVPLPNAIHGLRISGLAKTTGKTIIPAEITSADTTVSGYEYATSPGGVCAVSALSAPGGYSTTELWDLTVPSSPVKLGSVGTVVAGSYRPFAIYDNYLICRVQGDHLMDIYDISDPAAPVLANEYDLGSGVSDANQVLGALAVRDWIVYACVNASQTTGAFIEVIDISNPYIPVQLDITDPADYPYGVFKSAAIKQDVLHAVMASQDEAFSVTGFLWPTGHSDPDAAWSDEANIYDVDSFDTYGYTTANVAAGAWSSYVILTRPSATVDGVRIYASGISLQVDIDLYDGSWHDVYQGAYTSETSTEYITTAYPGTTQVRIRFYNGDAAPQAPHLTRLEFGSVNQLVSFDVSNPASISLSGTYEQRGIEWLVLNGDYAYATCADGTDEDKIVVLDISTPAAVSRVTAVGGVGAANYTGHDALFLSGEHLVNVGTGTTAAKFSVSYWDVSSPALPTLDVVGSAIDGDMDAACSPGGGIVFGIDIDNAKLRTVTPAVAGAWELWLYYYGPGDDLIDTFMAYDGDGDVPFTGTEWTSFSISIPRADIPAGATQVAFICHCDETTGYVYVDSLSAIFET